MTGRLESKNNEGLEPLNSIPWCGGKLMVRGENKENILECGLKLFYEQGFASTSVQEITDGSSVPKGSFYNYFKSKDDFAKQVLELYTKRQCEYLSQNLEHGEGSPLQRLRGLFEGWTKQFFEEVPVGCFAGNLAQELANVKPEFRAKLDSAFANMQAYYTNNVRAAQEAGEIDPALDAETVGAFLYNGWQGAMVRAKAQQNTEPFLQFQEMIFGRLLARR